MRRGVGRGGGEERGEEEAVRRGMRKGGGEVRRGEGGIRGRGEEVINGWSGWGCRDAGWVVGSQILDIW